MEHRTAPKLGWRVRLMALFARRTTATQTHLEAALRAERDLSRRYLDIAGVMLAVVDADEKISMINRTGCGILGYSEGELLGGNWFDLLVPDRAREEVRGVFRKLMAGYVAPVEHYVNPLVTKDGDERLISFHNTVLRGTCGEITGALCSAEDITERKRAQEEIHKLAKFPSENPHPILRVAEDGTVLNANAQGELLLADRGSGVGRCAPPQWCALVADVMRSSSEKRIEAKWAGRTIAFRIVPIPRAGYANWYGVDITELKRVEAERLDYQRQLRELALQLASAEDRERRRVAVDLHDQVGQSLAALNMNLQALRKASLSEAEACALSESLTLLKQMSADIRVLTFELCPPMLYETGLASALAWLVEQFQEKHAAIFEFEDDGQPNPAGEEVRCFVFRAVRELLANAAKYARAHRVTVSMEAADGQLKVAVKDDGIGLDVLKTSSPGQGSTGFGLFSIRERLRHLGGRLHVQSRPGNGSCLTMTVPLTTENACESTQATAARS